VRVQFSNFGILEKATDKDFDKSINLNFEFHNTLWLFKVIDWRDKGNAQKKMHVAVDGIYPG
jgi:hypothetical protein